MFYFLSRQCTRGILMPPVGIKCCLPLVPLDDSGGSLVFYPLYYLTPYLIPSDGLGARRHYITININKMLSYRRETALEGAL